MKFSIRSLMKTDCKELAAIRFESGEWGLLPALGPDFYTEILLGTCDSKWGFGKVCLADGKDIAGFIVASTDINKYYKEIMIKQGIWLAFWAMVALLKKPSLFKELSGYLNYSGKIPQYNIPSEWLTMVVRAQYRGQGLAQTLTRSVIEEYRSRNIKRFRSTVDEENSISCHLHDKFGFKLIQTFELAGQRINIYTYDVG